MVHLGKIDKVYKSLKAKILSGEFPNGTRLPIRRELTKTFGVSAGTVSACLAALEKDGLVVRRKRSGIFVKSRHEAEFDDVELPPSPGADAVQRVMEDVAADISRGDFPSGNFLPARKVLQFQFGTSRKTLNEALRGLEKRRLIRRRGNAYIVGMAGQRKPRQKDCVMVISTHTPDSRVLLRPVPAGGFLRGFETELVGNGVSFSGAFDRKANAPGKTGSRASANKLGYIYPVPGKGWVDEITQGDPQLLKKEMDRLARLKLPVAIHNSAPIVNAFPGFSFSKYRSLFAIGPNNVRAGEEVAVHLGGLGHRNIAFFSYSTEEWNTLRARGLRWGAKSAFGPKPSIQVFEGKFDRLTIRQNRRKHHRQLAERLGKLTSSIFEGRRLVSSDAPQELLKTFYSLFRIEHENHVLKPLFENALQFPEITAWACADPTVAIAAAAFLYGGGIRVPQQVSLISIDDNSELANRGIAAYDFQYDRMGYLAAHCLLGDIPVRKNRKGIVECPGRIIERGSVARV